MKMGYENGLTAIGKRLKYGIKWSENGSHNSLQFNILYVLVKSLIFERCWFEPVAFGFLTCAFFTLDYYSSWLITFSFNLSITSLHSKLHGFVFFFNIHSFSNFIFFILHFSNFSLFVISSLNIFFLRCYILEVSWKIISTFMSYLKDGWNDGISERNLWVKR